MRLRARALIRCITLCCLTAQSSAVFAAPTLVGSLTLPASTRIASLTVVGDTAYLGVEGGVEDGMENSLLVVDLSDPANPLLDLGAWLGVQTQVNDVAVLGRHAYLATTKDTAELMVVDLSTRRIVGEIDLPGPEDALSVQALGAVRALTRLRLTSEIRSAANEVYVFDISDPAKPTQVSDLEGFGDLAKLGPPPSMAGYAAGGDIVSRARVASDATLTVLAVDAASRQLQIVSELNEAIVQGDRNGDGSIHIVCLGDSNTFPNFRQNPTSWCQYLDETLWHPQLEYSSQARLGHRLVPHAAAQLQSAIESGADLAIFAFGTNDVAAGTAPDVVVTEMLALQATATAAEIDVLFATTPPRPAASTAAGAVEALNAAIEAAFPPEKLIDFWTGFTAEQHLHPDLIHVNRAATMERGARVVDKLRP